MLSPTIDDDASTELDAGPITIHLVGPFRVRTCRNADITPRSAKAQGILMLLATAPGLRRTRAWVQDKLWSEYPQEQGAGNLRQAILRLRQSLGPFGSILISGNHWLSLDDRRVRILNDPADLGPCSGTSIPEWCEGLDIKDPEFEDWIRDERRDFLERAEAYLAAKRAGSGSSPLGTSQQAGARPSLLLAMSAAVPARFGALADILLSDVASQVASLGAADVLVEQPGGLLPRVDGVLRLRVRAATGPEGAMFRLQLEDPARNALIRNIGRTLPEAGERFVETDAYQRFVAEAASVVAHELGRTSPPDGGRQAAWALGYRALDLATSFELEAHKEGERLLKAACEVHPAPAFLAWRAHFRVAAIIERHLRDPVDALDEAIELSARAMAQDPYNALVLAINSDVLALSEGRQDEALELARRAVTIDPANVYARFSHAYRLAWTSDAAGAHAEANRALQLASGTANSALWWMVCCMTATRCGRYREAVRFGTEAHRRAAEFRAPLRYLAALHYRLGETAATLSYLTKLKRLEPDFCLELLRDADYPVETLRRTPLLRLADSKLM